MLFPKPETWQKTRPQSLEELDHFIADFWREGITIYERLEIVLALHKRSAELLTEITNSDTQLALKELQQYCDKVIGAVANTPVVTTMLRKQMTEKLKIDKSYLPNHLPSHLSEPKIGETRKSFLDRRMFEHLATTAPRVYINAGEYTRLVYVTPEKVSVELMPQALKSIRDRDPSASPLPKGMEEEANSEEALAIYKQFEELSSLETQDFSLRETSRVIVHDGKLTRLQETETGLESVPADTGQNHSHGKTGWATMVINAKGEIFIHDHTDSFMHSSFMADAPVLFAGEIKIENGKIVGLSNYSGHYMPGEHDLARAISHLKDRALNLDECIVYTHNDRDLQEHENREICPAIQFVELVNKKDKLIAHYNELKSGVVDDQSDLGRTLLSNYNRMITLLKRIHTPADFERTMKRVEFLNEINGKIIDLHKGKLTKSAKKEIALLKDFYDKFMNANRIEPVAEAYISHELDYISKCTKDAKNMVNFAKASDQTHDKQFIKYLKQTSDDVGELFDQVCTPHKLPYLYAMLDADQKRETEVFQQYKFYKTELHRATEPVRDFERDPEFKLRHAKHETLDLLRKKEGALFQRKDNKVLLKNIRAEVKDVATVEDLRAKLDDIKENYRPHHGIYKLANFIKTTIFRRDEKKKEDTDTYKSVTKIEGIIKPVKH